MSSDPYFALGRYLTGTEAAALAAQFESGQHTLAALTEINVARRPTVKDLLSVAGLGHTDGALAAGVLRAIAGSKSVSRELTPVWTMPGNEAKIGHLTSEFYRLVQAARQSIVCATYNFEPTSKMWTALQSASEQAGVVVTIYIDGDKADGTKVKAQLPKAVVYKSSELSDGKLIVSHAKFVAIDHQVILLTSANFSFSAENRNIELGLLIDDRSVVDSIESTMASKHGSLYELV